MRTEGDFRDLKDNEIAFYLDTRESVPLTDIISVLNEINRISRDDLGSDYFLELVGFYKGSENFRFEAVRKMLAKNGDIETHKIRGPMVAERVRRAIDTGLENGPLAKKVSTILQKFRGRTVLTDSGLTRAPSVYSKEDLEINARRYESLEEKGLLYRKGQADLRKLFDEGERLNLVGKIMKSKPGLFKTFRGTQLPIIANENGLDVNRLSTIDAAVVAIPGSDELGIQIDHFTYADDR